MRTVQALNWQPVPTACPLLCLDSAADSGSKYGYRAALSNSEIDALFGEARFKNALDLLKVTPVPLPTVAPSAEPIASKEDAARVSATGAISSRVFSRFAIKASTNFTTVCAE
jgi:hypothetical protein